MSYNKSFFSLFKSFESFIFVGSTQKLNSYLSNYLYPKNMFERISCDNQEVQPTVVSGMHEQCAVAVIKLKNLDKNLDEVLQRIANFQKEVAKFAPKMKQDDIIPTVLAGVGFDTKFWSETIVAKKKR